MRRALKHGEILMHLQKEKLHHSTKSAFKKNIDTCYYQHLVSCCYVSVLPAATNERMIFSFVLQTESKIHYDKGTKQLPPLTMQKTVRIQLLSWRNKWEKLQLSNKLINNHTQLRQPRVKFLEETENKYKQEHRTRQHYDHCGWCNR